MPATDVRQRTPLPADGHPEGWAMIGTGLAIAGVAVAVVIALDRYLAWYLRWESKQTGVMTYYGKPAVERRALKRRIRLYSAPVMPVADLKAFANRHRLVTETCRFRYMKDHEELFEMAPPTMFSVTGGEDLKTGKASRDEDVSPALRERILDYCRRALRGAESPVARCYPDLAER
jgi:hypothetical protein